jgi:hypothetical protein
MGVRLWVKNTLLIDDWTDHGEKEDVGRITLRAGESYPVRLEYFYNGGQGVTRLWWTPPGGGAAAAKQAVPAAVLRPGGSGGGPGLRAEYFKGTDLKEPWGERTDPQVDFAWGTRSPIAGGTGGATALQIALTDGVWQAEWLDTTSGEIVRRTRVTGGGVRTLEAPAYDADIALRMIRQ